VLVPVAFDFDMFLFREVCSVVLIYWFLLSFVFDFCSSRFLRVCFLALICSFLLFFFFFSFWKAGGRLHDTAETRLHEFCFEAGPFKTQMLCVRPLLTIKSSAFCSRSALRYYSHSKRRLSPCTSINLLVFVMKTLSVSCAIGTVF
jgi:hypothetical protein